MDLKYIVKFDGHPMNFWQKPPTAVQRHVASVVTEDAYATHFDGKGAAIAAVKICRLDETQVTYHPTP